MCRLEIIMVRNILRLITCLPIQPNPGEEVISSWLSGYLFAKMGSYKLLLTLVTVRSLIAAGVASRRALKPMCTESVRSPAGCCSNRILCFDKLSMNGKVK
jgi:hypothetical protein